MCYPEIQPISITTLITYHKVSSPQAFKRLRLQNRKLRRPDLTFATLITMFLLLIYSILKMKLQTNKSQHYKKTP
ncbi:hypothetical protein ACVNPZ_07210 [Staphylococcus aureus]